MLEAVPAWQHIAAAFHGCPTTSLFEFDLDCMFYNINKDVCLRYVHDFFELMRVQYRRRTVAISKCARSLDRIGSGSHQFFHTINISDLLNYCVYELFYNDIARVGFIGYRQSIGVPMGGHISAQLATIFCVMSEVQQAGLPSYLLPMGALPSFPVRAFRYMDNIAGAYDAALVNIPTIMNFLAGVYRMPLKLEQSGFFLMSLEQCVISFPDGIQFMSKPLLHDCLNLVPVNTSICRIPPVISPSFPPFMRMYVSSAFLKSFRYASSPAFTSLAIQNLVLGLQHHGFSFADISRCILLVYHAHVLELNHTLPFLTLCSLLNSLT